ncbi:MAG TPA: Hsp20/alpha crystallin family protein [Jatrophihabitans sp.]|nr:Hsp20/alpha crystallin family protein [Jatrophihabitans sp.]
MTLMRFDPFRELERMSERVVSSGPRAMPAEAFRRGDDFFVLLDVPGVNPDDLKVTVERNVVSVTADFVSPRTENDEPLIDERPHGRVTRQFFLGDNLDSGKLSANCALGVLTLMIPVSEQSKPREITVNAASDGSRQIDVGSQGQQSQGQQTQQTAQASS